MAHCKEKPPDLPYITEDLVHWLPINLASKVKQVSPKTQVLLLIPMENQEVLRETIDTHIDGIALVSAISKKLDRVSQESHQHDHQQVESE